MKKVQVDFVVNSDYKDLSVNKLKKKLIEFINSHKIMCFDVRCKKYLNNDFESCILSYILISEKHVKKIAELEAHKCEFSQDGYVNIFYE